MQYPGPIAKLIDNYMKFPGIGQKAATRLALYTIGMEDEVVNEFAKSLLGVKRDLHFYSICGNITEESPCEICRSPSHDRSITLVVEELKDVMAMEKMRECRGFYHVLYGVLSPMERTGPEDINISSLLQRLHDVGIKEVIIATNATTKGEATATYPSCLIRPAGIKVTRLIYGLSAGSDIEYADGVTLPKAAEGGCELQISN